MTPEQTALLATVRRHRTRPRARPDQIEPAGPGEESVWDYPRPPEIRPAEAPVRVDFAGETIAASGRALRIVETSGAPVYYLPSVALDAAPFRISAAQPVCEWKGRARYFDLVLGDRISRDAAFCYPDPFDDLAARPETDYRRIAGWVAFHPDRVDAAWLGEERVRPQPGGYYAGWATDRIKGPLKGAPGSEGW